MRIDLEKLEQTGRGFSHSYEPGALSFDEVDLVLAGPAQVEGRARRREGAVELSGKVSVKSIVPCSRCLKKIVFPIEVEFTERFVAAVEWRNEEQHELRQEDLDLAVFDGEAIELDDLVREEIMLAVPAHIVCRDECKGLCPVCGIDLNQAQCECETAVVDPRWEKLKNLQF